MNYKTSSFIVTLIGVLVISWICAYILYPFADKGLNKYQKEKNVKTTNLSLKDKKVIFDKIGVPEDEEIESISIKEVYAVPKGFGEKGYEYIIKFTIAKDEYHLLEEKYEKKDESEVDEINDYYRLESENSNSGDDIYYCTVKGGSNEDGNEDELMKFINSKYSSTKFLIFIIAFVIIMVINISLKYKNGFDKK